MLDQFAVFGVLIFDRLVTLKHNVSKSWSNIEILLKQRHVVARLFSFRRFPLLRFSAEEKKDVDLKQLFNS